MSLIHRFWARVFTGAQASQIFIKDPASSDGLKAISWHDAGLAVATIMAFLRKKGVKKGGRVAILAWNSPEWIWANLAIQSLGAVAVPVYPNSKADSVNYVLKDSGALYTFAGDNEQIKKVQVGTVVHFDEITATLAGNSSAKPLLELLKSANPENSIRALAGVDAELQALGAGNYDFADDDLATFIYTSGSSGAPKGCMISHGNIAAKMKAMAGVGLKMSDKTDRAMSYLPLAHVLANIDEMCMCIWEGVPVTISSIEEMAENLPVYKPTMFCGVPAVWEKIYNGTFNPKDGPAKLLNSVFLWKPLLNAALGTSHDSAIGKFCDKHLFQIVRSRLGGKMRLGVSGGAPAAAHVLRFFKRIDIEIIEGYGATETLGGIITNRPSWAPGNGPKNKIGSVGYVIDGCEVRIVVQPGEEDLGSGEIQLRGPQVFKGYWNMPEATKEAFTSDGWFRTGDLGRMDADGFVYITGRMNGMYKTSGGKYVSREKVEGSLKEFPIVQYSLPVAHGKKYVVALVFVNQAEAQALVARPAPSGVDAAAWLAEQPEVKKAVADAIDAGNKKLERWEQIKKFSIMPIAATMENGIITETLKIRSKVLLKRFEKEIDALYAASGSDEKPKKSFKDSIIAVITWPYHWLGRKIFGNLNNLS